MKRKGGPEHTNQSNRRPRQDPVSCESCRKKKLKCDRQQPCSSCLTRRLQCSFISPPIDPKPESPTGKPVFEDQGKPPVRPVSAPETPDSRESLLTADWLEHIHMGDRVPAAVDPRLREELYNRPLNLDNPNGPARILLSAQPDSADLTQNPATVNLLQFLPPESDTAALFTYFCRNLSYLYHLIIPSRAEAQIHDIYRCVERGDPVNYNYLALLFAITGTSLFLQCSIESSALAGRCSRQFSFLTGSALARANFGTHPTIEGLQAVLIIFHNISNVHCCTSVRAFFTVGSVLDQAKNMLLHRIDTPMAREERKLHQVSTVDLELKRRLWWDIASFDWCLGFLSGPQEWTYLVNPAFMHTDKPSNLDDPEVGYLPSKPASTPTAMSYFLERLKLAETCRHIIDTLSPYQLSGKEPEYALILDLDRKMHQAREAAPDFFCLAPASRQKYANLYHQRPTLSWQRCLLQQAWYSRLCRLHRPFFIRGARDPTYAYSYVSGLSAARKVLQIKRIMDEEEPRFEPYSSSIWCVVHQVFMAVVMLVLDVCYNKDDLLDEKRREEALDAVRMLRRAQQSSALVKEGIDAMMGVLGRHYRSAPGNGGFPSELGALENHGLAPPPVAVSGAPVHPPADRNAESHSINGELENGTDDAKDLEEIWAELIDNGGNLDFEMDDWTGLFTDLNHTASGVGHS
ncbi:uncharacterized protein BDV14DRAFT_208395 [Aspergillus stella-maris]|uniref:uncharacterized protein n=1 Tax=Aspergillus stella-maris TaxID=1810926 RepID=UPI003CCE482C